MPTISAQQFFKGGDIKVIGSDGDNFEDLDDPGFLESLWRGTKNLGSNIGKDLGQRVHNINEIVKKTNNPLDFLQSTYQAAGQLAGGATDVVGEVAKSGFSALPDSIEKPIANTATKAVTKVAKTKVIQDTVKGYETWKAAHPEAAANLEATVNIASVLPVGKAGQIITKGAAKTATKVGGNVLKGVVDPLAEVVTTAGRATKGTGKALYSTAITPTVKEAERILQYKANTPFLTRVSNVLSGVEDATKPNVRATTALEKGLVGRQTDIGVKALRAEKELWNKTVSPALKSSEARITKDDLFAPALKRIEETLEPGKKQAYQDAFEAIQKEYKDFVDTDLVTGNKIKSQLDEFTPDKVFKGKPIGSEYTQLRADMASGIRQKIYESLKDKNIKKSFLDYSNLKELEKIGVKAISEGGKYGGFGSFWSSMWDMASTPVKTIGGKVLYKVGNKLEFVGDKGIKKFGDYLKTKGFEAPPVGLSVKDASKYNFTMIENGKKKTLKGLSREDLSDWIARANEQGLKYEVAAK